jgi:hypothetical protein
MRKYSKYNNVIKKNCKENNLNIQLNVLLLVLVNHMQLVVHTQSVQTTPQTCHHPPISQASQDICCSSLCRIQFKSVYKVSPCGVECDAKCDATNTEQRYYQLPIMATLIHIPHFKSSLLQITLGI